MVNTVPTERNGITNVIFNLISALKRNNIEIGYVAINNPDKNRRDVLEQMGAKLYVVPRKIYSPLSYVRTLSDISKKYDIVHAHGNSATLTLEMTAAKIGGVPVRIAHSHNTSCSMKIIDRLLRPIFYKLCNMRLACSNEAGKWLFRTRNFYVVNNGIDTTKFKFNEARRNQIRNKLNLQNYAVIGHVGNFDNAKNHPFIFEIFKELLSLNQNVRLLLLGDGAKREEYSKMVSDLKLSEHVLFMGSVDNPYDYMSAMDVILMPSLFEGLPLTLVEEQANGLRCIVSDAITKEVDLSGNVRFLSLQLSGRHWAEYINRELETPVDRSISSKNAISSIDNAEYSIDILADKLMRLYIEKLSYTS